MNTRAFVNPDNGEVRAVIGSDRRGTWYGTVWVEGGNLGMSGNFTSEAEAEQWVRRELGSVDLVAEQQ